MKLIHGVCHNSDVVFKEEQGFNTVMLFRLLMLVHLCAAFPLKCPEPAQWSTRARGHCLDPSKYFCLKNDLINGYSENCTIFDFLQPGRKNVLRGGLDADICSSDRYQPWPITFYTNVSTSCIFLKSSCDEQGQVIYGKGNRNTDITCRCDYTKGYDFIVSPRNRCFCVPSEEDCSCYLKTCQDIRQVLSSDYACIHPKKFISTNKCKPIIVGRKNKKGNQSDTENIGSGVKTSDLGEHQSDMVFLFTSILPVFIFLSFPFAIVIYIFKTTASRCLCEYMNLTIEGNVPEEGDNITITGKIVHGNLQHIDIQWLKDGNPVKISERLISKKKKRTFSLVINNCNVYDRGNYSIHLHGKKRSLYVDVNEKEKYNIPLEIQNMTKEDMDRYIKMLKEGSEKRYAIKIMILGKEGVGKTSLMTRLLREPTPIEDVKTTDGINIVKKCKVDMSTGEWIYCEADTTNERIARAMRKKDGSDSMTKPKKQTNAQEQISPSQTTEKSSDQILRKKNDADDVKEKRPKEAQLIENSSHDNPKDKVNERGEHESDKLIHTTRNDEHVQDIRTKPGEKHSKEKRKKTGLEETESIETVLKMGCEAKVPHKEYADCLIMDFAGHKEYHSTHQTFLTKNAIYLVVFSLKEDKDPFTDEVDETGNLSFWIDNIHCYASHKQQTGQNTNNGHINPPIIMICTGDDKDEDDKVIPIKKKKKEWEEKCLEMRRINQRDLHIIGGINFISNIVKSEDDFNSLRTLIFNTAKKDMIERKHDYPVIWINLEIALNKMRKNFKYVLAFNDIMEYAKRGHLSITSKEEVILFLKFQHEIGNLIFFDTEGLRDYVITDPSWLMKAFKCIICANEFLPFSEKTSSPELTNFGKTGVISFDLCRNLFEEKSKEHADNSAFVLNVMEKYDIIVNDPLNKTLFTCPCGIKINKNSSNYDKIFNENGISDDKCYRSPWLYMEFTFLPPALYNHLLVLCLHDDTFEKPKLYHEVGIFSIQKSKDQLDGKIILCKKKNTIKIQKVQSKSNLQGQTNENIANGQYLFNSISNKIVNIVRKYGITLTATLSIACSDATDDSEDNRYYVKDIELNPSKQCIHHDREHSIESLFSFWLEKIISELIPETVNDKPVDLKDGQDDEKQRFIHELFLKGESGKHHFARVVCIGKHGVGKTSLMRRLLWNNKKDVTSTQSTDGIEVEKCNINIADGKWSPCNKIDNDLTRLIHQVYKEKSLNEESSGAKPVVDQKSLSFHRYESKRSSDTKFDKSSTESEEENNFDDDTDIGCFKGYESDDTIRSVISRNEIDLVIDENINKMISTIMKSYLQYKNEGQDEKLAFCWLWDLAGQKDFYATHQVFMLKNAVYLLVTDSLEFSTAENQGLDFEGSAQYVSFWFDAIHCYWSATKKGRLDPPIIVVCTNEDKFKEPLEREKRQNQFKENLRKILNKQEKRGHLRNIYFVSNTEDADIEFEKIRNEISRQAMAMQDWGKDCPLKWLLFQQVLLKLKDSNVPISSTQTLLKIAKHKDIGINEIEEVKQCLHYCHDIGTIIYFDEENLADYVILDPKWLVNAFRCLVSVEIENVIKVSDDWQRLTDTGKLTESLISRLFRKEPKLKFEDNKAHIIEVMKRFDIIVNLKNSTALYMPCMMKSCSFSEVKKQLFGRRLSYFKTSWLCLEFKFLPPVFFNHVIAWYIHHYHVSVIIDKESRTKKNALYRHIGVFDLDSTGCKQLVVCEGTNTIALQVWDSRMSNTTYEDLGSELFRFVDTLRKRYSLHMSYTKTFTCKDGDFTINRKTSEDLVLREFRCSEHKTNHLSDDLVKPWIKKLL